jgi:cell wall-associated NlpC family hydrolase
MILRKVLSLLILFVFIIPGCSIQKEPPESFKVELDNIKSSWAPDKRTSVFNIEYEYKEGHWSIQGETTVADAQKAATELVRKTFTEDEVNLDIKLLPPEEFGDTTHALVNVSVGNLRSNPRHRAEMVDQVLMGMVVKLIKAKSYWYLVQTPTDYLGWITRGSIQRLSDEDLRSWETSDRYTFRTNYGLIFSEPSEKSQSISDLVLGSVFIQKSGRGSWMEIELPDGRTGFIKSKNATSYQAADNSILPDRNRVVEWAKTMMGIPYIWGGHSTKAFDCSGFTSTVFRTEGYQLPRDASMQVHLGEEVIPDSSYTNILPGDLIFFGSSKRITHVGICLGGSYFIHASGDVHVNSLDEDEELFSAYRKNQFRHIKRILKN